MAVTFATICEKFADEMDIDLAVYAGNGEVEYVTGTSELCVGDVSAIRNMLRIDSRLPFTLMLKDSNYLCLKTSDGILCAKGGFNCVSSNESKLTNKKKSNRDAENPRHSIKKLTSNNPPLNSDIKMSSGEKFSFVQGFVNKGFVENELDERGYSNDNGDVSRDIVPDKSHNSKHQESQNVNNNNNNIPDDNRDVNNAHLRKKRNETNIPQKFLANMVKRERVSKYLLATTIQSYTLILRGMHDGQESWLKMVPHLSKALESLNREE